VRSHRTGLGFKPPFQTFLHGNVLYLLSAVESLKTLFQNSPELFLAGEQAVPTQRFSSLPGLADWAGPAFIGFPG
jgi:hypothetical protein